MIKRPKFLDKIAEALEFMPVATLLGPRQCGKTTLAREFSQSTSLPTTFFDLEDPIHWDQLQNPKTILDPLSDPSYGLGKKKSLDIEGFEGLSW